MKKRHPLAVLLLPIPTLGIYCLYWIYETRREIIEKLKEPKAIPSFWLLVWSYALLVVLFIVTLLAMIADPTATAAERAGAPAGAIEIVTFVILMLFFLGVTVALPVWWFWHYCKAAVRVTEKAGSMDFTQSYILYIVVTWICNLFPVWMLIQQIDYNKVADKQNPTAPPSPIS